MTVISSSRSWWTCTSCTHSRQPWQIFFCNQHSDDVWPYFKTLFPETIHLVVESCHCSAPDHRIYQQLPVARQLSPPDRFIQHSPGSSLQNPIEKRTARVPAIPDIYVNGRQWKIFNIWCQKYYCFSIFCVSICLLFYELDLKPKQTSTMLKWNQNSFTFEGTCSNIFWRQVVSVYFNVEICVNIDWGWYSGHMSPRRPAEWTLFPRDILSYSP